MFYPCIVKDKDGKVKKKYSSKQLKKRHWKEFQWKVKLRKGADKKPIMPVYSHDFEEGFDSNFYLP